MKTLSLIAIWAIILIGCKEETNAPLSVAPFEQWQANNLHNYSVEQTRICFCINGGQKMKIIVHSDSVYSVMRLSDSTIIPYPSSKQYLTIDSLFGIIRNSKTDSLIVTYDTKYGYPNILDINPQLHPVDGGVLYETSNLQVLK